MTSVSVLHAVVVQIEVAIQVERMILPAPAFNWGPFPSATEALQSADALGRYYEEECVRNRTAHMHPPKRPQSELHLVNRDKWPPRPDRAHFKVHASNDNDRRIVVADVQVIPLAQLREKETCLLVSSAVDVSMVFAHLWELTLEAVRRQDPNDPSAEFRLPLIRDLEFIVAMAS